MGNTSVSSCISSMFVSCVHPQYCVLHDLQFLNAGRSIGRGILHSRSHDCLIDSHACLIQSCMRNIRISGILTSPGVTPVNLPDRV